MLEYEELAQRLVTLLVPPLTTERSSRGFSVSKEDDYEPGELCPYLDCGHDLAIPDLGWYQCGCCGRSFYASDCDSDYADYNVLRADDAKADYGAAPDNPTSARDLGPSWASPEVMNAAKADLSYESVILKSDAELQTATAVVYPAMPSDWQDSQNDWMDTEEIRKMAWTYMSKSRKYDKHHTDLNVSPNEAVVVESWLAPVDFDWPLPNGTIKHITKGSWVLTTHFPDPAMWERVRAGEFKAYSIRGIGKRREMK